MIQCDWCGSVDVTVVSVDYDREVVQLECNHCGDMFEIEDFLSPLRDTDLDYLIESAGEGFVELDDYQLANDLIDDYLFQNVI